MQECRNKSNSAAKVLPCPAIFQAIASCLAVPPVLALSFFDSLSLAPALGRGQSAPSLLAAPKSAKKRARSEPDKQVQQISSKAGPWRKPKEGSPRKEAHLLDPSLQGRYFVLECGIIVLEMGVFRLQRGQLVLKRHPASAVIVLRLLHHLQGGGRRENLLLQLLLLKQHHCMPAIAAHSQPCVKTKGRGITVLLQAAGGRRRTCLAATQLTLRPFPT
jgi:hypothetical protein